MKKSAEFFDEAYFEKAQDGHKSNYTRVGGYRRHVANIDWPGIAEMLVEKYDLLGRYVLDVGCGYGYLVRALRQAGANSYGVDISEFAIEQTVEGVGGLTWQSDIAEEVPTIPDRHPLKKWDLIVSLDVLEHVETKTEAEELLESIAKQAYNQYHKVNTGEFGHQAFGGDQSHGLAMPLAEWEELAGEVSGDITVVTG